MKRLVLFAIIFFSCQSIFAQKTDLSQAEIDEYTGQIQMMVRYLEETFSFIGDPEATAQEKDIIFKESYAKIFLDDEVQIEDDLDDNRSTYINKDVQAYLKDIDFFFNDVKFTFKIDDIKPQTNETGDTYFKVTMMRTIEGHTIVGDSVNNSCKRFMEVNIDPAKKDLKIASMYTTKPNETEELRTWWNRMSAAWKLYFGEGQIVHIYRDSVVIVDDSLVESTIPFDMPRLYARLTSFTKTTDIDINGNKLIHSLDPLYELSDLQNLDCSNTDIEDITPIRNLNKLNRLDISNTAVRSIADLRYTNDIRVLKIANLDLNDISIVEMYSQLTDLDISGTKVSSLDSIELPQSLRYLNISNTQISDLTPLAHLENLQVLIMDDTPVSDLTPIANLSRLNELQCRNTNVGDIMPLKDMTHLVRIYCDNTYIDSDKAAEFKRENRNVMVIYETKALQDWWESLPSTWKTVLAMQNNTDIEPNPEELHIIIGMKALTLSPSFTDAAPIERLTSLERLGIEGTGITDLTPLHGLHNLKYLNMRATKVHDLKPLENLGNLLEINIENTPISDLTALHNMKSLAIVKAEHSNVTSEQVFNLRNAVPNVMVLYQTNDLRSWWNTIDGTWRDVFRSIVAMDANPTAEQLQSVANIEEIVISDKIIITSLEPLSKLMFLKKLSVTDNHITDLSPLSELKALTELHIDGNALSDITALATVTTIEVLSFENTRITDLNPLENMHGLRVLDIASTSVKNVKVLAHCTTLEELNISNTNVRTLAPVANLESLKYIKAIGSKVKSKEIDKLRASRPELNILYH